MIEAIVIIALLGFIAYQEWGWRNHVKELEEKIIKTNPQLYWLDKREGKKVEKNQITTEDENEVLLSDLPMPEMDMSARDFKIQLEGDSETPAEARARGER